VDILVYCKDCQSRNSWVRKPARDIKDINGKPIECGYKCAVCGHTTLVPADKSDVTLALEGLRK
jgi:hypothetical protein